MLTSIRRSSEGLLERIGSGLLKAPRPRLQVLTQDEQLLNVVERLLPYCHVRPYSQNDGGILLIDPTIGLTPLYKTLQQKWKNTDVAIIRTRRSSNALFLAMKMSGGHIISDPRIDSEPLKLFLTDALGIDFTVEERRIFPRANHSGVKIISPEDTELINISPHGAAIRTRLELMETPLLKLRLGLGKQGSHADVDTKVTEAREVSSKAELRLCFYKAPPEVRHELIRISTAELLCNTIQDTFRGCDNGEAQGFRKITGFSLILALLGHAISDRSLFTFSVMHKGRPVKAIPLSIDPENRHLTVSLEQENVLDPISAYYTYATTIRHESYLMDGYLLKMGGKEAVLTLPKIVVSTDHRSQDREAVSPAAPIFISFAGEKHVVKEFSPRGFSFYLSDTGTPIPDRRWTSVVFDLGQGVLRPEVIRITRRREEEGVLLASALFTDSCKKFEERPYVPIRQETIIDEDPSIIRNERAYSSEPVVFHSNGRSVAGLISETYHQGELTLVIIPPAWAKTKESTALLSQYILDSFDENRKAAAVLRIDYTNALGESEKAERFNTPGHETLGLTFSACVEDIQSSVTYLVNRMASRSIRNIALVGMSFSGPLCLRAAVTDKRITLLIQYMGASDIQDLVRTATGGIDYVSRFRAGMRNSIQNVLGILSDTDRWCADGVKEGLVMLQESESDASRLSIPLCWIHGIYDAFVNEHRILKILEMVQGEKFFYKVPHGHIPTKSMEAIQSFAPALRFLLKNTEMESPILAAPTESLLLAISQKEWERAPRVKLPSLREFWRGYMTGKSDGGLGFDILSMTRGYQELMTCQVRLLEVREKDILFDIGGGMGHVTSYLEHASGLRPAAVRLFDFIPELFELAEKRAFEHGVSIQTHLWRAESGVEPFQSAHLVLMSLFLSCLQDPLSFLKDFFKVLPHGARVVASSIRPDADISQEYMNLLVEIKNGTALIPNGYTKEGFLQAVRDYMNSAAFLLRLTEEGAFHLFDSNEFIDLFETAGFKVIVCEKTFGTPGRAIVIKAVKDYRVPVTSKSVQNVS